MRHEPLDQLSDKELVDLCRDGDDAAFTELYNRYRLQLFSYLHRLLSNDKSLVDDIFQQVWIRAVRSWQRYTDQQLLLAWLCRIAHNLVMDHFRSKDSKATVEVDENLMADTFSPEEALHQLKLDEALQNAIEQLPPDQQEIVRLRMEGLAFKEIAEQKQISINTALGRMHYAVQNLRNLLSDYL
jgi:RNA polymerase sigma-70 factor (ECF subfamily)